MLTITSDQRRSPWKYNFPFWRLDEKVKLSRALKYTLAHGKFWGRSRTFRGKGKFRNVISDFLNGIENETISFISSFSFSSQVRPWVLSHERRVTFGIKSSLSFLHTHVSNLHLEAPPEETRLLPMGVVEIVIQLLQTNNKKTNACFYYKWPNRKCKRIIVIQMYSATTLSNNARTRNATEISLLTQTRWNY